MRAFSGSQAVLNPRQRVESKKRSDQNPRDQIRSPNHTLRTIWSTRYQEPGLLGTRLLLQILGAIILGNDEKDIDVQACHQELGPGSSSIPACERDPSLPVLQSSIHKWKCLLVRCSPPQPRYLQPCGASKHRVIVKCSRLRRICQTS
jgi:hypothetical protein